MKNTIKKFTAGLLALVMIAGAVPANTGAFDLFTAAPVVASAATTVTDELTASCFVATGTHYEDFSNVSKTSSAKYAGNTAKLYDAIQLRTSNYNSGIVTTASGGKAKKITVAWNSNTKSGRTIDIYGKNSAYENAADLYNTSKQGTKLGSITKGTNELTITGDYEYIGLRSNNGALYLDSVDITWEADVAVTGVTLDKTKTQTINVGSKVAFTATVAPEGATDKTVKWTSSSGVKLYSDEKCTTEVGADATDVLTVYAKGITAGNATVTVTSNANATKTASCDVTVNAAPTIFGPSVTLGDDLALNIYVDGIANDTEAAEYTMNFTGACVDSSSALSYNEKEGKYYATTHVYAKNIDKDITATLCKGSDTVDTLEDYSITQYLSSPEFSEADDKTTALITAIKDFGNASAEYFYGTGSGYSDGFASYNPDVSAYATTFGSDDALLSLVLDSKTAARLYVKGDTTGTESTFSDTKADYPTYHEITGLLPQNLADEHTITVGGTDYKFSALSWCYRVLTNGNASQKNINMAKAIMAYYEAAKNYSSVDVSSVTITNAPTEALFVNSTGTLTATVSPDNATDKTVVWSSSDPDYVSINAETGEYTVMGKKGYGSATITATATNGTEDTSDDVKATCTITGKVTYTSLSVGTVLHTGDTFYTGSTVYFQGSTAASFTANMGVITIIEATKSGYNNKYYQCQRGSNGTYPIWAYVVKDNTDGIYITGGSGTKSDKFTLAVHTK